MSRKISSFRVGLFFIVTFSLFVVFVLWIGFSHLLEKKKLYVSYFAESVKGLQKDAVVNYRGVPIGRVERIAIAPDGRLVEVVLAISEDFIVDDSLVVRLKEQGITGLRYLEVDSLPPGAEDLSPKINFTPPYPLIRSYPSEMQAVKEALERLYYKVISVDFQTIADEWIRTAKKLQEVISDEDLRNAVKSISTASKNLESLSLALGKSFKKEPPEKLLKSAGEFLRSATNAANTIQNRVDNLDWESINKSMVAINKNMENFQLMVMTLNENLTSTLVETQNVLKRLEETIGEIKREPGRLLVTPEIREPFRKEKVK